MPAITFSRIGRIALDLLYPPSCALCGRGGSMLCGRCLASLPVAAAPRCGVCWVPLIPGRDCRNCAAHPPAFTLLRSAFRHEGQARELVHCLKFRDLSSLAEALAPPLTALIDWQPDVVVPVPLTPRRERQRGYNQSALLAKAIADDLGLPIAQALRRCHDGPHQALSPSREQRWINVEGAFEAREPAAIRERVVLLVDDVATTGATLDACARAALLAGATEVTAVTFARQD